MMNEEGSAQGNIISPILANIYMHNVLTLWYKFIITKECKTQLRIFCQFVFFRDTDIELLLKISSNFKWYYDTVLFMAVLYFLWKDGMRILSSYIV